MKLLSAVLATAVLNASALAAPVEAEGTSLEGRAPMVTCRPKLNGKTERPFHVDVATARAQARKAGLSTGKSGDPHRYHNGDGLSFGVHGCDKKDAVLWEFPIYWVGKKAEWAKDVKTDRQPGGPTPLRVVYANSNGGIQYCGVMTHSEVNDRNQGLKFFQKCT